MHHALTLGAISCSDEGVRRTGTERGQTAPRGRVPGARPGCCSAGRPGATGWRDGPFLALAGVQASVFSSVKKKKKMLGR